MASLLQNMLQPATPIQAQAVQSPQAPAAPQPQDNGNLLGSIMQGVGTAASIAGLFTPAAPAAAALGGANIAARFL